MCLDEKKVQICLYQSANANILRMIYSWYSLYWWVINTELVHEFAMTRTYAQPTHEKRSDGHAKHHHAEVAVERHQRCQAAGACLSDWQSWSEIVGVGFLLLVPRPFLLCSRHLRSSVMISAASQSVTILPEMWMQSCRPRMSTSSWVVFSSIDSPRLVTAVVRRYGSMLTRSSRWLTMIAHTVPRELNDSLWLYKTSLS